jgi:hypothetical protein
MLEAALLILVATGGLWMLSQHLNTRSDNSKPLEIETLDAKTLSPIAGGGLYCITKAGEHPTYSAFSDLQLAHGGFTLCDSRDGQVWFINFAYIQWVSAVILADDGTAQIVIHIETNQQWRLLHLRLAQTDMMLLTKVLRRVLPSARLNLDMPVTKPIGPIPARAVDENLQGEITLGQEIKLYILPHMLIVLHDDTVQAKLDMSSFRRVLSIERISRKFDSVLNPNTPEGMVRIHSLYETAAFALPQYRQLAEELSYLSRCPLEFIVQEDKTHKS